MFTGLVSAIGTVRRVEPVDGGRRLDLACPWDDLAPGESLAVDGACLTVEEVISGGCRVHVVVTTLDRTRFADLQAGDRVNLERALRAGDRLGGHLVQGHVDGVGRIVAVTERDDARLLDIAVPRTVADATVPLGSVTVDGVSLTVNAMPAPGVVQVALIPFTLHRTTLGERRPGDRVHLEGDTVAKYLRALAGRPAAPEAG